MREPAFWRETSRWSRASAPVTRLLLTPIAALYGWVGARKIAGARPFDPGIPVICIGNLTVGGVGKTPLTLMLRQRLTEQTGRRVATLSRGYGGALKGPLKVRPTTHSARDVGDEPLMMAQTGESWIGADRAAAAKAMAADGVELILMDDGFQNPALRKHISIVAIDAASPFGNGFVFPKGPLRESVVSGLARANLVVMMGDGPIPDAVSASGLNVLHAAITADQAPPDGRYVAFAGIGNPIKFFDTLTGFEGVTLCEGVPFPDHHPYSAKDIADLHALARRHDAQLITTEKDLIRLMPDQRKDILALPVTAHFRNADALATLDAVMAPALNMPTS